MLNIPIEQEIETENKVIKNLNKRQVICAGIIGIAFGIFYAISKDLIISLVITLPIAFIFGFLGWRNEDGLKAEDLLVISLSNFIYKNKMRKFRTRNKYFDMYNKAYSVLRNKDAGNKKIARQLKKNEKINEKRRKRSAYKCIL